MVIKNSSTSFTIRQHHLLKVFSVSCTLFASLGHGIGQEAGQQMSPIVAAAEQLIESANISYAYGGSNVGTVEDCARCNTCIEEKNPKPKKQLEACPECNQCSLDCSNFVTWAFRTAGFKFKYLTTRQMIELPRQTLASKYQLIDLRTDLSQANPGDLLVYPGHVVILSEIDNKTQRGTVLHATGGKDLRGPGMGLQKERLAPLISFRGPLQRILRYRITSVPPLSTHGSR